MIVSNVKKIRSNVEVIFENEDFVLVPYEIYLKNFFSKGDFLTNEKIDKLKNQIEIYKITQSSLRYLSGRNHSKYELKIKLQKKQYNIEKINEVLSKLENQNFLNDEEFAKNFYKNQLRKKRGVLKIKADLYKKGVNRNLIEKIIRENINTEDFIESAKILANKKINMLKKRDIPEVKIKQKVFQFLASRGFTSEVINKTLKIVEMED